MRKIASARELNAALSDGTKGALSIGLVISVFLNFLIEFYECDIRHRLKACVFMPFVSQLLNINFGNGKLLFLKGLVFG